MIPPILHQTWKSKDVPANWRGAYESCQSALSSYTKYLWTDDEMNEFVKRVFPEVYNVYISYPYHIQRCDAFRYMVLYHYGGIYLDLDIGCKLSLDSFLEYDLVLSRSSNFGNSITNSLLMIKPGHPFFRYIIDNLDKYKDSFSLLGKHLHVMNSTGPLFLGKMYKKYISEYGPIPNMYFLTNEEYAGDCNVCNVNTCKGGEYFTHVGGNSWHAWDSTLYNIIMCHWMTILAILIVIPLYIYLSKKYKTKSKK